MSRATGIVIDDGRGLELTERMLKEHRDQRLLEEEERVMNGRLLDERLSGWFRDFGAGQARVPQQDIDLEARDKQLVQRDLSVGITTGGGFTVASEFARQLIESMLLSSGIRAASQVFTTQTGAPLAVPVATGASTASIVTEGALIGESDPTFAQVALGAFKYALLIDASNELLRDSAVDLTGYLAGSAGRAIGAGAGAHFATGSGTGQPAGAVAAGSPYTVSTAPTGNVTAFSAAAISQFAKALPAAYRPSASWIMHPDDYVSLAGLGDVFPSLHSSSPTLLGSPVLIDAALPAPAASAKSLLYGDMSRAYVIREVAAVRFDQAPGQSFGNDVTRFRVVVRTDGRPALAAACVIGQHSAT